MMDIYETYIRLPRKATAYVGHLVLKVDNSPRHVGGGLYGIWGGRPVDSQDFSNSKFQNYVIWREMDGTGEYYAK